ncbi:MAG: type II toxin-antitoxin system RelE/ParE family toxin [Planctomycetales bacterium]|nr:type II toxin-antitoxin system RelE/ParE family toxin [Planctomycetales bacterium]
MLESLPPKHFRQVVTRLFALLRDPHASDTRLLKGFPFYRISVGEYRVVYDYSDDELRILVIGKRNDDEIYKAMRRKFE